MPVATQAKLLRVLEDRKLRRLGSKSETTVDVRVLAATNKVPEDAVARVELRNDLYYRLNVFNIHMPPLREHKEDMPELLQNLLMEVNTKHGRKVAAVSEAVLNLFRNYAWPSSSIDTTLGLLRLRSRWSADWLWWRSIRNWRTYKSRKHLAEAMKQIDAEVQAERHFAQQAWRFTQATKAIWTFGTPNTNDHARVELARMILSDPQTITWQSLKSSTPEDRQPAVQEGDDQIEEHSARTSRRSRRKS